ncbi:OLC1v1031769C1 [Oldenlandia corymbosa var. corymbosa]|uniref:OLC1v1031769C1 n=1 Tax=Oldenlandia corymbosa var. corymbosa TaxID=529605 RepID=A0AAV1CKW8_OLDCO|nr:OLC1v1031769C1 [Oldenlandia corymbosa var. corymbosa]
MILKHQRNKFVPRIKGDVLAVVCDAGVLIFSFQIDVQLVELEALPKLLEAIKVILEKLGEKDLGETMFNNSRSTTQLAFVDSLLQKLKELISSNNVEHTSKSHAKTIQEELFILRSFLGNAVELQHDDRPEVQTFWNRVSDVAYRVENIITILHIPYQNHLVLS